MPKFIISFGAHAMDHIDDADMPAVADAAHGVVEETINAGVYVLAGGLADRLSSTVSTDGAIIDGPKPGPIGGLTVIDVPTRKEALEWAAKIAVACRCAQEVWEMGTDPLLEAIVLKAKGNS